VKLKTQKVNSIGTVNDRWCNAGLHQGRSKQRRHAQGRKNVLSFTYLLHEGNKCIEIRHMKLQYSNTATQLVYKWSRKIKNGASSITEDVT
jgi:hypothetical protein